MFLKHRFCCPWTFPSIYFCFHPSHFGNFGPNSSKHLCFLIGYYYRNTVSSELQGASTIDYNETLFCLKFCSASCGEKKKSKPNFRLNRLDFVRTSYKQTFYEVIHGLTFVKCLLHNVCLFYNFCLGKTDSHGANWMEV